MEAISAVVPEAFSDKSSDDLEWTVKTESKSDQSEDAALISAASFCLSLSLRRHEHVPSASMGSGLNKSLIISINLPVIFLLLKRLTLQMRVFN